MGPILKQEDLQRVVDQVNGRFDWFTKRCEGLEKRIEVLEKKLTPAADKKEKAA